MSFRQSMSQLRPAHTQKVDLQEKVQQIFLTESTTFSTSMENVIGSCFQAKDEKELQTLMKTYSKDFNVTKSVHKNNIQKLMAFGEKVRDETGSGKFLSQKKGTLTPDWKVWGGKNPTSKTDITLSLLKCSVKNMDGAQLMSGTKGESNATANAAAIESTLSARKLKPLTDAIAKLEKNSSKGWFASVENLKTLAKDGGNRPLFKVLQDKQKKYQKWEKDYKAGKVKKGDAPSKVTKDEKRVLDNPDKSKAFPTELKNENKEFIENMEGMYKDATDDVYKTLDNLFKKNNDFKLAFVHEAATGNRKFGKNAPQTANYVLSWRKAPSIENFDIRLSKIASPNSKVIKKYASQIQLIVNWKSSSRADHQGYNMWQTIRLGIKKATDERKNMNESFYNELNQYQMQLNEGVLNEFAFFDKVKELASDFVNKAKELWNRFTNFISEQINRIIEISKQGLTALSNALGFDLDVQDSLLNNEVLRL